MIGTGCYTKYLRIGEYSQPSEIYELLSITTKDTEGLLVRMIVAVLVRREEDEYDAVLLRRPEAKEEVMTLECHYQSRYDAVQRH
jgi:DNA-binding MarR family transcriptional regulator